MLAGIPVPDREVLELTRRLRALAGRPLAGEPFVPDELLPLVGVA